MNAVSETVTGISETMAFEPLPMRRSSLAERRARYRRGGEAAIRREDRAGFCGICF